MAAKKKGATSDDSTNTTTAPPPQDEVNQQRRHLRRHHCGWTARSQHARPRHLSRRHCGDVKNRRSPGRSAKDPASGLGGTAFGATNGDKSEGEGDHVDPSRKTRIIQQAQRGRVSLQVDAEEVTRTTPNAGKNARTTTPKGDGHNQPTTARAA